MYEKLIQILHNSIQDSSLYVVVLTGTGSFFSSGNDFNSLLTGMDNLDAENVLNIFK